MPNSTLSRGWPLAYDDVQALESRICILNQLLQWTRSALGVLCIPEAGCVEDLTVRFE